MFPNDTIECITLLLEPFLLYVGYLQYFFFTSWWCRARGWDSLFHAGGKAVYGGMLSLSPPPMLTDFEPLLFVSLLTEVTGNFCSRYRCVAWGYVRLLYVTLRYILEAEFEAALSTETENRLVNRKWHPSSHVSQRQKSKSEHRRIWCLYSSLGAAWLRLHHFDPFVRLPHALSFVSFISLLHDKGPLWWKRGTWKRFLWD